MIKRHTSRRCEAPSEPNHRRFLQDRDHPQRGQQRMRRTVGGGGIALMLVLAACGSSGSDGAKAKADTDKSAQSPTGDDVTDSPEPSEGGTGIGRVEIGDVKHDFTIDRCMNMGAINGGGVSVSDPDTVDVSFEFPPEDAKERPASEGWGDMVPSMRLDSEEPYAQWEFAQSVLDAYDLSEEIEGQEVAATTFDIADDGESVTGEGQFFDVDAVMAGTMTEPVTGTFSFSCPPKA